MKPDQLPSIPFGRAPLLIGLRDRSQSAQLCCLSAVLNTFWSFSVEQPSFFRRAALFVEAMNNHFPILIAGTNLETVSNFQFFGRFDRDPVVFHLADGYRICGYASRLVETGGPEPFIETHCHQFLVKHWQCNIEPNALSESQRELRFARLRQALQ